MVCVVGAILVCVVALADAMGANARDIERASCAAITECHPVAQVVAVRAPRGERVHVGVSQPVHARDDRAREAFRADGRVNPNTTHESFSLSLHVSYTEHLDQIVFFFGSDLGYC